MAPSSKDNDSLAKSNNGSRKRPRHLPDNVMVQVLKFCDASDYISMLRASEYAFATPLRLHLWSSKSLSLSFLLKKYPNSFRQGHFQQLAVHLLLQSLLGRGPRNQLRHLELSNLRGITGASWFPVLSRIPLVTLDLTNCLKLEHDVVLDYLMQCPQTLRNLNLIGCKFVGQRIVDCIRQRHPDLVSVSLGSCSQNISTVDVFQLLRALSSLKHLDLQCLTRIQDRISAESEDCFMDILPDSLESLNLTSARPLRLISQDVFGTMNTYLQKSLEYMQNVQGRVENIQEGLRALNDERENANEMLNANLRHIIDSQPEVYIWKNEPTYRLKVKHLVLDNIGPPRSGGVFRGAVATFSLGRCLREVHLGGCEGVTDWEIQALAVNCGETLTCFQMRAGSIGNPAIQSLAKYCRVLGELDVCGCFEIGDDGIVALCENLRRRATIYNQSTDDNCEENQPPAKRRLVVRQSLTILRAASLPKLTNRAVEAMAQLKSLIVLDVHGCTQVEPSILCKTVTKLPRLVEVNAKYIAQGTFAIPHLLRNGPGTPRTLKRVNGRVFHFSGANNIPRNCCVVRSLSQKRCASTPLAAMYHCVDCNLIPELDRGFCVECLNQCHAGHKTYLGSLSRFSCDCPFGSANATNRCKAINPSKFDQQVVGEAIDIEQQ